MELVHKLVQAFVEEGEDDIDNLVEIDEKDESLREYLKPKFRPFELNISRENL